MKLCPPYHLEKPLGRQTLDYFTWWLLRFPAATWTSVWVTQVPTPLHMRQSSSRTKSPFSPWNVVTRPCQLFVSWLARWGRTWCPSVTLDELFLDTFISLTPYLLLPGEQVGSTEGSKGIFCWLSLVLLILSSALPLIMAVHDCLTTAYLFSLHCT